MTAYFEMPLPELAERLDLAQATNEDIVEFVKLLDQKADDWDVTRDLHAYTSSQMQKLQTEDYPEEEMCKITIAVHRQDRAEVFASSSIPAREWDYGSTERSLILLDLVRSYIGSLS